MIAIGIVKAVRCHPRRSERRAGWGNLSPFEFPETSLDDTTADAVNATRIGRRAFMRRNHGQLINLTISNVKKSHEHNQPGLAQRPASKQYSGAPPTNSELNVIP